MVNTSFKASRTFLDKPTLAGFNTDIYILLKIKKKCKLFRPKSCAPVGLKRVSGWTTSALGCPVKAVVVNKDVICIYRCDCVTRGRALLVYNLDLITYSQELDMMSKVQSLIGRS